MANFVSSLVLSQEGKLTEKMLRAALPYTIHLPKLDNNETISLIPPRVGREDGEPVIKPKSSGHPLNATFRWSKMKLKQSMENITEKAVDPTVAVLPGYTRFVCVSDTHATTSRMGCSVPDGDVLIHAGDFSNIGKEEDIKGFNEWLGSLPHKYKVVIAGNHDVSFDEVAYKVSLASNFNHRKVLDPNAMKSALTNCIYLEDYGVNIRGHKIFGSPWQPEFFDWGFNLTRGQPCLDKWEMIPTDTDILVTHGPAVGYGDLTSGGDRAGCVELLNTIQMRVKPKAHVFGHIHEGYGVWTDGTTRFYNASTCTLRYKPTQEPLVFDLKDPTEDEGREDC